MTALPSTAVDCWFCGTTPAIGVCCSSHNRDLCHRCYRLTHFVERCVDGCRQCAAEGLPVVLTRAQSVCECESYDCAGECCGVGRCSCTPAPGEAAAVQS